MSVLLETSKGDLVVDLYTDDCPLASKNFLKLCKIKCYNNNLFHYVVRDFIAQTGDPTGTGSGGDSINGILYGEQARFFDTELRPHLRHKRKGMLSMAAGGKNLNASQFYITTGAELDSLDGKNTIFGEVTEGWDVLDAINEAFVDDKFRPIQNIRIRHTVVLDDPFPDPPQLADHEPEGSPPPVFAAEGDRLEDDWKPTEDTRDFAVIEAETRKLEAEKRAEVLEMVGDLPTADAKPPADMIFVCKLNPVTTEEDLEVIFSRFGKITSCDIIRDWKTGDSLCYAFIGFDSEKAAEDAFFKMDNVLIDDRRIHVDFSQSMHHLWRQFKAFGKAGSAALGNEADKLKSSSKKSTAAGNLELKAGAARGLYAGPVGGQGRGYVLEDEGEDEQPGRLHGSGRKRDLKEGRREDLRHRSHRHEDRYSRRNEDHKSERRDRDRGHSKSEACNVSPARERTRSLSDKADHRDMDKRSRHRDGKSSKETRHRKEHKRQKH